MAGCGDQHTAALLLPKLGEPSATAPVPQVVAAPAPAPAPQQESRKRDLDDGQDGAKKSLRRK